MDEVTRTDCSRLKRNSNFSGGISQKFCNTNSFADRIFLGIRTDLHTLLHAAYSVFTVYSCGGAVMGAVGQKLKVRRFILGKFRQAITTKAGPKLKSIDDDHNKTVNRYASKKILALTFEKHYFILIQVLLQTYSAIVVDVFVVKQPINNTIGQG